MFFFNALGLNIRHYVVQLVAVWQALPGIFCRAISFRNMKKYLWPVE
tara:strand:- start:646 stop:786 length:141 start_codon:yes stop_codon:yes gene_type:complete